MGKSKAAVYKPIQEVWDGIVLSDTLNLNARRLMLKSNLPRSL